MSNISWQVLQAAADAYARQCVHPTSPVEYSDDGKPCLCAAAMAARVGLEMSRGNKRSEAFVMELVRTKDKQIVLDAFSDLGWPLTTAHKMFYINDVTPSTLRMSVIPKAIRTFAQ